MQKTDLKRIVHSRVLVKSDIYSVKYRKNADEVSSDEMWYLGSVKEKRFLFLGVGKGDGVG